MSSRSTHRRTVAIVIAASAALVACSSGGSAQVKAAGPGATGSAAVTPAADASKAAPEADPAEQGKASGADDSTPDRSESAAPKTSAKPSASTGDAAAPAQPTAAKGLGACPGVKMVKAGRSSGKAPVQFANGWTAGPVGGCTYTDKQGRTYKVTAAQNRMLYRVNQMRTLQTRKDGRKRPILRPDFCLQELAQDYTNTKPSGHNPFLMKMYNVPGGGGAASGSVWIGENLGGHYGYTSKRMAMVDRLVYNWFTSGSLSSGHYGNMMDKDWTKAGFGLLFNGSSVTSIQNFSADPAYYAYPGGKKCSKPPKKKHGSSTVPPIGPYPDPPGQ